MTSQGHIKLSLNYIYSQSLLLDTSVTWFVGICTQKAEGANRIVWDAKDIFRQSLYSQIDVELEH